MKREPRLDELEHRFRQHVQTLDLAYMQARIEHYRSGGIKSANLDGTARGDTGSRTLTHDPTDARGYQDIRATIRDLHDAEQILRRIASRQSFWADTAPALPDPVHQACENCTKPCDPLDREDRLRSLTIQRRTLFVCAACYAHGRRRGTWRKPTPTPGRTVQTKGTAE